MIQVGNTVKITAKGRLYSRYDQMARAMNITDTWVNESGLPDGVCIGKVIAIKKHFTYNRPLYAILINGQSYIMGENGVELVDVNVFDDDLFEL